jgi:hypothetical protein
VIEASPDYIRAMIDPGKHTTFSNMRILSSIKLGIGRRKKIYKGEIKDDLVKYISAMKKSMITYLPENRKSVKMPLPQMKQLSNVVLSSANVNKIMELVSLQIGPCYRESKVFGGMIMLRRIMTHYCLICQRTHDSENALVFMKESGDVIFKCFRCINVKQIGFVDNYLPDFVSQLLDDNHKKKSTLRSALPDIEPI